VKLISLLLIIFALCVCQHTNKPNNNSFIIDTMIPILPYDKYRMLHIRVTSDSTLILRQHAINDTQAHDTEYYQQFLQDHGE
jgi:hypothetical protein